MASQEFWRYPSCDASRTFFDDTTRPKSFLEHICARNFHERIVCPRTNSPVTFAVCGDLSSPHVILYCLPSGCSRYLGVFMHGICALAGVKLIAIDRPGSGGTPMCASSDRMRVSLEQTVSVLCALDLLKQDPDGALKPTGPSISLLAHSVGFLYALDLIRYFTPKRKGTSTTNADTAGIKKKKHPSSSSSSPFGKRPRLILSSPWVPTSQSKSTLAMVPSSLIRMNSTVMPGLNKAFGALNASFGAVSKTGKGCFGWSAGVVQALPRKASPTVPHYEDDSDDHAHGHARDVDTDIDHDIGDSEGEPSPQPHLSRPASATGTHPPRSSSALRAAPPSPPMNPFLSVIGLDPPPSPTRTRDKRTRDSSLRKNPTATFHPPHTLHYRYSMSQRMFSDPHVSHPSTCKPFTLDSESSAPQLVFDMMAAEGYKGITEDFLLSLGHLPTLSSTVLETKIKQGIEACSKSEKGAEITVVWASGDKIVPARGRAWLDDCIRQAVASSPLDSRKRKRLRYDRLEMVDAGHDSPMGSEAVVVELLRRAKLGAGARASAAGAVAVPTLALSLPTLPVPVPLPSPTRHRSKHRNIPTPPRRQEQASKTTSSSRDSAAEARAFEDAERVRAAQEDSQRLMRKKTKKKAKSRSRTRTRTRTSLSSKSRRGNSDPDLPHLGPLNDSRDPEEELTTSSSQQQQLRSVDRLLAKKKKSWVFASYRGGGNSKPGTGETSAAVFAGANANSNQRRGFLSVANHQAHMASLSDFQDDDDESAATSPSSGSCAGSFYSLFSD